VQILDRECNRALARQVVQQGRERLDDEHGFDGLGRASGDERGEHRVRNRNAQLGRELTQRGPHREKAHRRRHFDAAARANREAPFAGSVECRSDQRALSDTRISTHEQCPRAPTGDIVERVVDTLQLRSTPDQRHRGTHAWDSTDTVQW
jgi:hypothetical protein